MIVMMAHHVHLKTSPSYPFFYEKTFLVHFCKLVCECARSMFNFFRSNSFFRFSLSRSPFSVDSFFFSDWQKSAALSKIINFDARSDSAISGTQILRPSKAFFKSTLRCLSIELWRSRTSLHLSPLSPLSLCLSTLRSLGLALSMASTPVCCI